MLTRYGHGEIKWGGDVYRLSPTLANISKLGTPKEIVDDFKMLLSSSANWRFAVALNVVNACLDRPIPEVLSGSVHFSEHSKKLLYVKPKHNMPMFNDIIVLAEHCFTHGLVGDVPTKGKGSAIDEFDPYEYIELARVHMEMSKNDSADLTMTEFCRMMETKFPPEKNENQATAKQDAELLKWFEENNEVH